jgi:large subunit ribosomal protein L3
MPGRMGGNTVTVQNLKVIKIDTKHDLISVKGAVPGVDNQFIKVTDSIKKGWHDKLFPKNAKVPFPTCYGNINVSRELTESNDDFKTSINSKE